MYYTGIACNRRQRERLLVGSNLVETGSYQNLSLSLLVSLGRVS